MNEHDGRIFGEVARQLQGETIEAAHEHTSSEGHTIPVGTPGQIQNELRDHGADMYGVRAVWTSEKFPGGLASADYWQERDLELFRAVPENAPQRDAILAAAHSGLTMEQAAVQTYERYRAMTAADASRALWENASPAPTPEVFRQHSKERER